MDKKVSCVGCRAQKQLHLLVKGLCLNCCYQEHQRGIDRLAAKAPSLKESFGHAEEAPEEEPRLSSFDWNSKQQCSGGFDPDQHYSFKAEEEAAVIGLPKWSAEQTFKEEGQSRVRARGPSPLITQRKDSLAPPRKENQRPSQDPLDHWHQSESEQELPQYQREHRRHHDWEAPRREEWRDRELKDTREDRYRERETRLDDRRRERESLLPFQDRERDVSKKEPCRAQDWARERGRDRDRDKDRERDRARRQSVMRQGMPRQGKEERWEQRKKDSSLINPKEQLRERVMRLDERLRDCTEERLSVSKKVQPKFQPRIEEGRRKLTEKNVDYEIGDEARSRIRVVKPSSPEVGRGKSPDYDSQYYSPKAAANSKPNRYLGDWRAGDQRLDKAVSPGRYLAKENEARCPASELFKQRQEQRKQKLNGGHMMRSEGGALGSINREIREMRSKLSDYRERIKRD